MLSMKPTPCQDIFDLEPGRGEAGGEVDTRPRSGYVIEVSATLFGGVHEADVPHFRFELKRDLCARQHQFCEMPTAVWRLDRQTD